MYSCWSSIRDCRPRSRIAASSRTVDEDSGSFVEASFATSISEDTTFVLAGDVSGPKYNGRVELQVNVKEKQTGSVTIKVPAKSYTETMSRLRRLASKVKEERADAKDVTEEFTDLQAQVRNLEAVEEQYQSFMKKANTIDEVLKVQQKLTEVRGQIERLKGRMGYLERQSDMATITAILLPEAVEKPQDTAWRPFKVAREAWEASLRVLEVLATIVITVGVFSIWAVPLLALAAYLMRVFLRRRPAPAIDSQPGQG